MWIFRLIWHCIRSIPRTGGAVSLSLWCNFSFAELGSAPLRPNVWKPWEHRNSIVMHARLTQVQRQRAGAPIFDTIVELERGQVNKWTIVRNVDLAVDAILSGKPYKVEQRTRIPHDSDLQQPVSAS